MPKRQSVRQIASPHVQGAGSWVRFRRLTYGESKAVRAEAQEHANDETDDWAQSQSTRLLVEHVVAWNWLDDEDQPLPTPAEDVTVIDRLTDEEVEFLTGLFQPQGQDGAGKK